MMQALFTIGVLFILSGAWLWYSTSRPVPQTVALSPIGLTVQTVPDIDQKRIYVSAFTWGAVEYTMENDYTGTRSNRSLVKVAHKDGGAVFVWSTGESTPLLHPSIAADVQSAIKESILKDQQEFRRPS